MMLVKTSARTRVKTAATPAKIIGIRARTGKRDGTGVRRSVRIGGKSNVRIGARPE
jgi:hypothetical protein